MVLQEGEIIKNFNTLLKNFSEFKNFKELEEIKTLEDIKKIPLTTRADLEVLNINDCPVKPYCTHVTSGLIGKNIPVFYSKSAWETLIKRVLHVFKHLGLNQSDISLNLFEYGLSCEGIAVDQCLKEAGVGVFGYGNLNKEEIYLLGDLIKKVQPTVLVSFTDFIYDLIKANADLTSIKKVMYGGRPISNEFFELMTSRINAIFYDAYGCNEVGLIGIREHKQEFFEVIDDGLHIEVMGDNNEASEIGEGMILITDLHNYSTPLIRYITGDKVKIIKENDRRYLRLLGRDEEFC